VGYVETMLGRRRQLRGALDRTERSKKLGHAMRAAINTPIQVPPHVLAQAFGLDARSVLRITDT
jgi:DNA polymerase I-like protein with 3'-5' exonuclease and polymerase domains